MNSSVEIVLGSSGDIGSLESLWVSVHHAHAASMPELAPYVSDAQTWEERSATYRHLIDQGDASLVLARIDGGLVGYAFGAITASQDSPLGTDTWEMDAKVGEVISLSVLPDRRGQGIGTALLDALSEVFEGQGVRDVLIGVLPGNHGARRLYERLGFLPTWLYLSRISRRPAR